MYRLALLSASVLPSCEGGELGSDPRRLPVPAERANDAGWTVTSVATVAAGRLTGNISITGHAAERWIVWEDSWLDATDDRQHAAHFDGATVHPPELLQVATSSSRPSIAADADHLFVLSLMDCPTPNGCGDAERQVGLRVLDRATGDWTLEPIDAVQTRWDHGRSDLALVAGEVHACYVVHFEGAMHDEVLCTVRDVAGGWTEPVPVSGGRSQADDHPFVLVRADGNRAIGFTSKVASGRRAAVWLEELGEIQRFDRGQGHGEDVGLVDGPDGTRHVVWREARVAGPDSWELMHATCPPSARCDRTRDWTITSLAGPARIDAPDVAITPDGTVVTVWTEDDVVQVGWECPDGLRREVPDGSPGIESTERGQPSIRVAPETGAVDVVYRKETDTGTEIRWAGRASFTCD